MRPGLVSFCVVTFAVLAASACAPDLKQAPFAGVALPISDAGVPYADFEIDGHTTIEVHHIVDACGRHPRLPCRDDSHWRLRFASTEYDDSSTSLEALRHALIDTADTSRRNPNDRNSLSDRRLLLVVDPAASWAQVERAIERCAASGMWNLSFLVRHPARLDFLSRLDAPLRCDKAGPMPDREPAELRVSLAFDTGRNVPVRKWGAIQIPPGEPGDRELRERVRQARDGYANAGKDAPGIVDAKRGVPFQQVIDVFTLFRDIGIAQVEFGFPPASWHDDEQPPAFADIELPLSTAGVPYDDFDADDHLTLDVHHATFACARHPTQPCSDDSHWRFGFRGVNYFVRVDSLDGLRHALGDAATATRTAPGDRNSPSSRRLVLVVDPTAPYGDFMRGLVQLALAGWGNTAFAVRDRARPGALLRLDHPLRHDRAGPAVDHDAVTINLSFDATYGVLTRRFGRVGVAPGAEGDRELAQLIRERHDTFAKRGKDVPGVVDAQRNVPFQHVIDAVTLFRDLKLTRVELDDGSLESTTASPPERR